nr:MAG TPA: hypothetical protein [Caudoviricetes sp.]
MSIHVLIHRAPVDALAKDGRTGRRRAHAV